MFTSFHKIVCAVFLKNNQRSYDKYNVVYILRPKTMNTKEIDGGKSMRKWRWQIAIATAAITTMMIPGNKILAEEAMTGAEEQSEYNMRFADDGTESGVTIYYGSLYNVHIP